ncbi:MAG: glycosyltransferase family 2 protein [Nitrospirota bacterium]
MAGTGLKRMDNAAKRYLVIIPAFNEEKAIAGVIEDVRKNASYADILIINDGSTDLTSSSARGMDVMVIDLPFNLGYGAALQTGFRFAVIYGYDYAATVDADGQHIPSYIANLVSVMQKESADVVIGSRFIEKGYRVGIFRKTGIWLFSKIARIYTGCNFTDPTSGFQLINRDVFTYLSEGDNYPLDYPDVNIILALHKKRFRIAEAPVVMVGKSDKKSMHSGLRPLLYIIKMSLAIIMVLLRKEGK